MGKNDKKKKAAEEQAKPADKDAGKKKKSGGWKAQLEEEEKQAKLEEERKIAIKNRIKFVRARHILNQDQSLIQEIHEKLKIQYGLTPPEDEFAKIAEEISECPSKDKGGLLGYFQRGQMEQDFSQLLDSPAFEEVAFKTPVGQMSDLIKTENGFHILMVIETK